MSCAPPDPLVAVRAIDWSAPWWDAVRAAGARLLAADAAARGADRDAAAAPDLPAALNAAFAASTCAARDGDERGHADASAPVRFAPQHALPRGVPYERFVFETRTVPTRCNLHDLFNGLVWCAFPRAKARLNALQHAQIARDGVGAARGPVRDAITLLDENGALLAAPDALWRALAARAWPRVFGELRPLWRQARLWVFGHAALEKLVAPYKSITAHVLALPPELAAGADPDLAAVDAWLSRWLTPERLAAKPFAPLPLAGVPGWCAANASPEFYADAEVFRPPRAGAR